MRYPPNMLIMTILCLGDSLTAGARAEVNGHAVLGYPERLPDLLAREIPGTECATLNRGISGETTRQILARTPAAVRELTSYPGPKHVVLLAGTNDSKGAGIPLDEWETLYRQTIHWVRRAGLPLILCTYPPVDPRVMPAFTEASQAWLLAASVRVRAIAAELHCAPSPVRVVELADFPVEMLCDGVHLTREGYAELARRVCVGIVGPRVSPPSVVAVPPSPPPKRRGPRKKAAPIGVPDSEMT